MAMFRIPSQIQFCRDRLLDAGFAAYLVGGCVRDFLLGNPPVDYDITTSATPVEVLTLFPHAVPTGLRLGTVTVPTADGVVEITTFRTDGGYSDGRRPDSVTFGHSLTVDLARRDFTINAMALDLDCAVIDPYEGQTDLAARLIKCVGSPTHRFSEDALRMFRAVRFSAQLDFTLNEDTMCALYACAPRAAKLAGERIYAEMTKTLCSPRPECAALLLTSGLLTHLQPDITAADLSALRQVAATPEARWSHFCTLTGFPICALPVPRSVRQAVLHPERAAIRFLSLPAEVLLALGLSGPAIGEAQRRMARLILDHPEENTPTRLLAFLQAEHII
ncbi:MAG: tRNA nucleotidyltransferase [Oscillospiraceae bacterium]|nr:tRNA nucleotidyltransferase [Oscillospiraceae bacterium]